MAARRSTSASTAGQASRRLRSGSREAAAARAFRHAPEVATLCRKDYVAMPARGHQAESHPSVDGGYRFNISDSAPLNVNTAGPRETAVGAPHGRQRWTHIHTQQSVRSAAGKRVDGRRCEGKGDAATGHAVPEIARSGAHPYAPPMRRNSMPTWMHCDEVNRCNASPVFATPSRVAARAAQP